MRQVRWLAALIAGAFLLAACGNPQVANQLDGELALASDLGTPTYTEDWDGRGADSEKCRILDADDPRADVEGTGWIHWVFSTKGASTDARLHIGAEVYEPGEPLNANVWHFYTPFADLAFDAEENVWTVGGEPVTIKLYGGASGPGGGLVISDYCPGDAELSLDVRKTAFAEFDREHHWLIDKNVTTEFGYELEGFAKIWLFTDGSGDEKATWTIDVTYDGYIDSNFVVYGEIEIENVSASGAIKFVTSIVDDLGFGDYDDIDLSCVVQGVEDSEFDPKGEGVLPKAIAFGQIWVCSYEVEVDGAEAGDFGTNSVTVLVEGDDTVYGATADWMFDEPKTELYATVNIKDISDLFGEVDLGTVTAPNDAQFTYEKDFAFEDFDECGAFRYDNTAEIVETGQTADATLKVNVQCVDYESAWAEGQAPDAEAFAFCDYGFANWGWTNEILPGEFRWPLWAGAAQCDTSKGTLVGSVGVVYDDDGNVTVTFTVFDGFLLDEDTAVYAGYEMFPTLRNGRATTAPGQYTNSGPFDGSEVFVIAHANVGIPDPNFGPASE